MIYADHNATSPVIPEVREYLKTRLDDEAVFANPSSLHSLGKQVEGALENCRLYLANLLGANIDQLIFNSGATEGISHIFYSVLSQTDKKTIITSDQEHAAVVQACEHYQSLGYKIIKVETLISGVINLDHLKKLIQDSDIALVSIIAANNETGVIQPYEEIGSLCQEKGIPFFPDTTQLIGKQEFSFANSQMDYAVLSGHKLGSLTGIGLLLVKNHETLKPMIFGGYQESDKRSGTQHYLGVETLTIALDQALKNLSHKDELKKARDEFENNLKKEFADLVIFGKEAKRLEGTSLLGLKGVHGQAVQLELESHNIFVTTSSACSDNEPETSKVLKSMGVSDDVGRAAIRISLKNGQNPEDYKMLEEKLSQIFHKLQKIKYD